MKNSIILTLFILIAISCKFKSHQSSSEAFTEDRKSGPLDRIYLAIKDQAYELNQDIETIKNSNNIDSSMYLEKLINKNKQLSYSGKLSSDLSVLACFNEKRSAEACIDLKPKEKIFGDDNSTIEIQTSPDCNELSNQIKQNSRFRYHDFPVDENFNIFDYSHFPDFSRTNRCVELFQLERPGENLEQLLKQSSKYNVQFSDKVRLALGASCILNGAAAAGKYVPKVLSAAKISKLLDLSKIAGTSKSTNALYRGLKLIVTLDDYIIQLAKQITPQFRVEGAIILKKMLIKVVNLLSKYSILGIAKTINLTPTASKIIYELNSSDIKGQMTLLEAIDYLNDIEKENPKAKQQVESYVNSSLYKSVLRNLEKEGLDKEELVYIGLTTATIWVPLVSCVTLARDINEVSNKVNKKDNLIHLYQALIQSESDAKKKLVKFDNKEFAELASIYRSFQSKSFVSQNKINDINSPMALNYKTSISIYQSIINHYTSYYFNKSLFKNGFKHKSSFSVYGETEAFQIYVKEIAEAQKKNKGIFSMLLLEALSFEHKTKEIEIDLEELINESHLNLADLQKHFEEIYKEGRYE